MISNWTSFILAGGLSLCVMGSAMAKKSAPSTVVSQTDTIKLYSNPSSSAKIAATLPANTSLVRIFQKDHQWVKVGVRRNGQVGWIYRPQYQQAMQQFYQPNVRTVVISTNYDKNGKRTDNIVATENGKAISPEEAKKLYRQYRQQQIRSQAAFDQMGQEMNRWMNRAWLAPWSMVRRENNSPSSKVQLLFQDRGY